MLDVLDPVEFDTQHVGRYDDNQRTRSRGIEIGRRRSKSRNHSQVVAAKDKKPEARDERKHEAAFLASDADHEIFNPRYHHFEEILSAIGNHFEVTSGKGAQTHQQQYDYPRVGNVWLEQIVCETMGLGRHMNTQLLQKKVYEKDRMFHKLNSLPFSS